MAEAEKQTFDDDQIDELGREVAGRGLTLLNAQLKKAQTENVVSISAVEAYANAVTAGLAAMRPEEEPD